MHNNLPVQLFYFSVLLVFVAVMLGVALALPSVMTPKAEPVATTQPIEHRVIGVHQDSIDVRYALKDIKEVQGE